MYKSILALLIAIPLALCGLASSIAAAPTIIKLSNVMPENDPTSRCMAQDFKDFIETKSNGRYQVNVYPNGSMGNCDSVFQAVQFGNLHIALDSTSNLGQFVPEFAILDMPFLFRTKKAINEFLNTKLSQDMLKYIDAKGVKGLNFIFPTYRAFICTEPWNTLADLKNKKVRATASKAHIASLKSLGVVPTPMPYTEMLTGLQQRVIVGADPDFSAHVNSGLVDVAKYVFNLEHIPVFFCTYASKSWLKSLSAEDRALFEEGFKIFARACEREYVGFDEKMMNIEREKYGVKIRSLTGAEKKPFIEASRSAYNFLSKKQRAVADQLLKDLENANQFTN